MRDRLLPALPLLVRYLSRMHIQRRVRPRAALLRQRAWVEHEDGVQDLECR